ncbi:hypothetical protein H9P43_002506 [Blastocladiella emersonii ATCC 22665]|nr:hypothetical protein H9P43_002506 [Blastocladiella emersonii ATCC 22665]
MVLPPPGSVTASPSGRINARRVLLVGLLVLGAFLYLSLSAPTPEDPLLAAGSTAAAASAAKAPVAVVADGIVAAAVGAHHAKATASLVPTPSPAAAASPSATPAAAATKAPPAAAAPAAKDAKQADASSDDEADDEVDESPAAPPAAPPRGPLYAGLTPDASTTLLVVVPSSYSAMENSYRKVVRSTWGKWLREYRHASPHIAAPATNASAQLFFFIGTRGLSASALAELRAEHAATGDLVFLDFEESYRGLSAKMVLLHEWVHDNRAAWPALRFVFKTDTDVWFNVPELMRLVDTHRATQTMIGYKYVNNVRLLKGKWANPEYSSPVYPQYMAGAGYLLSVDIASWVATNARAGWLKPLPNEDAVLGIWLAGSPVDWIHSAKFKPLIDPNQPQRITRLASWVCRDDDILFHHLTDEGIRRMHASYAECGSPCEATCRELQREAANKSKDLKLAAQAERKAKQEHAAAAAAVAAAAPPAAPRKSQP